MHSNQEFNRLLATATALRDQRDEREQQLVTTMEMCANLIATVEQSNVVIADQAKELEALRHQVLVLQLRVSVSKGVPQTPN